MSRVHGCISIVLFLLSLQSLRGQDPAPRFIDAFTLEENDLALARPTQPFQYFDKIGRQAGLMGYESGSFEMWIWPWKPLRNFELSFLMESSTQPIMGRDIVRTITATPEATLLTYTHESFTVREIIIVPREEPGAILLLDVHATAPLTVVAGFVPVMQPMWPAGIGGQFSYWDDESHAYVISEAQWRAIVLCGSPAGVQMAAPPAHMFADNPLQFKIAVNPGDGVGRFIPIVIAGSRPDSASGKMKMDSVKATYGRLWRDAASYYRENVAYYRQLRSSTIQLITPDAQVNLACEWGKVALDNLMVRNPRLGYGMVAGFGLSGGGARPGFAWYFGGDAFINALAFNTFGAYQTVRDALAFTQKWQRQDNVPIRKNHPGDPPRDVGKMAHELSQSDGFCDWWNDYRYGYNHADTTPWYLVAVGDYVRSSGDVEFLRTSWESILQAYSWCLSKDSDGDGLMDLKGAGLGALEFGKLVGIYADVYTCGVWVQAIKEMIALAELVGDAETAARAQADFRKAAGVLDRKFWIDDLGYYAYGVTEQGEQVREKTPWSGVAMMFDLLDRERTARSLRSLGGSDLCTDWGVRTLSKTSELFEPTNYNYGAVWPFISCFFNTAQFRHHEAIPAYQVLRAVIPHAFDNALGCVPEVFSGEMNQKLGEAYHHQGFSTTGYILPLLRGLVGLEVDAVRRTISMSPHIPAGWDSLLLRGVRIGGVTMDFTIRRDDTGLILLVQKTGSGDITVNFAPSLPQGSAIVSCMIDGISVQPDVRQTHSDIHGAISFSPSERTNVRYVIEFAPEVGVPPSTASAGATNRSLRILSQTCRGNTLVVEVEGLSGETYTLRVHRPEKEISVKFPPGERKEYVKREITISLR